MSCTQAREMAFNRGIPVVVPNEWGRFDYAFPGGNTAHQDTLTEVLWDLAQRGFESYLAIQPETVVELTLKGVLP